MQPDTYPVNVDGLGTFQCRRRTMRVAVAITAEYNRLTEGADQVGPELGSVCNILAFLKTVVADAPDGWDPYAADPDSPDEMAKIEKVYSAIKVEEGRFRNEAGAQPKGQSQGNKPVA